MQTKKCSKCGEVKPLSEFNKQKAGKFGVNPACKDCRKKYRKENREAILKYSKKYREENQEAIAEYGKKYYQENREAILEYYQENREARLRYSKKYYQENKEAMSKYFKKYREENREYYRALVAEKKARKAQATPPWLCRDLKKEMEEIYATCPEGYHVDHIVPIKGKTVCGLHVPWNLQHLPAEENLAKGNRYWPDMWELEYG